MRSPANALICTGASFSDKPNSLQLIRPTKFVVKEADKYPNFKARFRDIDLNCNTESDDMLAQCEGYSASGRHRLTFKAVRDSDKIYDLGHDFYANPAMLKENSFHSESRCATEKHIKETFADDFFFATPLFSACLSR